MKDTDAPGDGIREEWLSSFRSTLGGLAEIPEEEWRNASARVSHVRVDKGDYFLRQGDTPSRIAFVASGLFRVFVVTERGDERIMAFRGEGRIISAFSPYLDERRSWFAIQALEDSDLLSAPLDATSVAESADCWKTVYARYVEMLFVEKEEREREFLCEDAETRYASFVARYPDLANRIPQYQIASYLGITPVALSRIRRKRM